MIYAVKEILTKHNVYFIVGNLIIQRFTGRFEINRVYCFNEITN